MKSEVSHQWLPALYWRFIIRADEADPGTQESTGHQAATAPTAAWGKMAIHRVTLTKGYFLATKQDDTAAYDFKKYIL